MNRKELPFIKFLMLLSSLLPLFVLVGIKGMGSVVSDCILWICMGVLVIVPLLILYIRYKIVMKNDDVFNVVVIGSKMETSYLFTYLLTVLLPVYSISITTNRELAAVFFAVTIVFFVLWNLNLHFINFLFALMGYRVFVLPKQDGAILLSKRSVIAEDLDQLLAYRLGAGVFIEKQEK